MYTPLLLVTKCIASSSKKLLVAGAARSKDAMFGAPGRTRNNVRYERNKGSWHFGLTSLQILPLQTAGNQLGIGSEIFVKWLSTMQ